MKSSLTSRVHRWWSTRQARHQRLEQFRLLNSLPEEIRSDIAGTSLVEAFDDGSGQAHRDRLALRSVLHQR